MLTDLNLVELESIEGGSCWLLFPVGAFLMVEGFEHFND